MCLWIIHIRHNNILFRIKYNNNNAKRKYYTIIALYIIIYLFRTRFKWLLKNILYFLNNFKKIHFLSNEILLTLKRFYIIFYDNATLTRTRHISFENEYLHSECNMRIYTLKFCYTIFKEAIFFYGKSFVYSFFFYYLLFLYILGEGF